MSFTAKQLPFDELKLRHEKCRQLMREHLPSVQGILVFSRTNIYYLSGSRANGILWLPLEGEPVLMVRKGEERCRLESPLKNIVTFKSYSGIPDICSSFNASLGTNVGAEMRALPWSLAQMLTERLKGIDFMPCDFIFNQARFTKTTYEIELLKKSNALHMKALQEQILGLETHAENSKVLLEHWAKKISTGMTELEIAHNLWHRFFALGHGGMLRLHGHAQEFFLGKISAGKSSLYPSPFKGCVGLVGEHPSMPFMGYSKNVWQEGELLVMDTAFMYEGYHSANAMTYWGGSEQSLPSNVCKAYDCCLEIVYAMCKKLQEGQDANSCLNSAKTIAKNQGFMEGFMGFNDDMSLAYGLGLELEENLIISNDINILPLQANAVFCLGPMIALENLGMVGLKHSFIVNEDGIIEPFDGLELKQQIECI